MENLYFTIHPSLFILPVSAASSASQGRVAQRVLLGNSFTPERALRSLLGRDISVSGSEIMPMREVANVWASCLGVPMIFSVSMDAEAMQMEQHWASKEIWVMRSFSDFR